MASAGRPSTYSPEIADAICERIADGESMRAICEHPEMPGRRTVLGWLEEHEEFRAKYARAREAQADVMDDKILTVADTCTPENAAAARVKIEAYKWRAAKLKPKVYGDAMTLKGDKQNPLPVEHRLLTPDALSKLSDAALAEIAGLEPDAG